MTDFKVGDRVMYTGRHSGYVSRTMIDQHGTVTNLENASIRVQWDSGKKFGVFRGNIEPITPDVITINRADLPEVVERGGVLSAGSGPEECVARGSENPNWLRNRANSNLALADFIEARDKYAEEVEAKRSKRRDELAAELAQGAWEDLGPNWYGNVSEPLQKAIDRIIELENKAHE